jgi:hypothetical protein
MYQITKEGGLWIVYLRGRYQASFFSRETAERFVAEHGS